MRVIGPEQSPNRRRNVAINTKSGASGGRVSERRRTVRPLVYRLRTRKLATDVLACRHDGSPTQRDSRVELIALKAFSGSLKLSFQAKGAMDGFG